MWKGLAAALIRALARVHRWNRMLGDGKYRSASEIAEAENVTRSFVNRLLRLTLLAPDIVKAILDGRQAKSLQLAMLTGALPSAWEEQRQLLPTTFACAQQVQQRRAIKGQPAGCGNGFPSSGSDSRTRLNPLRPGRETA
jgi:hypothetical protein